MFQVSPICYYLSYLGVSGEMVNYVLNKSYTHRILIGHLNLTEVFLTLTEVFPCFFLSCKAYARVKLAKTGHGSHSTTLVVFVLFGCYLCCSMYCLCVNVYCHPVTTQLQLTLRRLTSYIYGAPILDVSRSHTTTEHSR